MCHVWCSVASEMPSVNETDVDSPSRKTVVFPSLPQNVWEVRPWGGHAKGSGNRNPDEPTRLVQVPTIRVSSVVLAKAAAFVWPLAAYDAATPLQCLFVQHAPFDDPVVMVAAKAPCHVRFFAAFDGTLTLGPKFCCPFSQHLHVMRSAETLGVVWFFAALNRAETNTFWAQVCCAGISQTVVVQRAQVFGVIRFFAALNHAAAFCFLRHGISPVSCLIGSTQRRHDTMPQVSTKRERCGH
jgi:hypothetical protein